MAQYRCASLPEQRQILAEQFKACRAITLAIAAELTEAEFFRQSHPDFSPVGWHLGHIALTESLWIGEQLAGNPCPYAKSRRLFAADGLPKDQRQCLPDLPTVVAMLATIRDRTLTYLSTAPLDQQHRLWWWLLQHESQHVETISIVLALHRFPASPPPLRPHASQPCRPADAVLYPSTQITLGYDAYDTLDNEFPVHATHVDAFLIDPYPVTNGEFRRFMAAGGYQNPDWWTPAGWAWRQAHAVSQPLYWPDHTHWENHPVCGVSWYEADAYARFVGKRLPTETEWERVACWNREGSEFRLYPWGDDWPTETRSNQGRRVGWTSPVGSYPDGDSPCGTGDLMGNVWEWTNSWFDGYDGFQPFPYRGYSQAYFDGQHRVLRGGSWATLPWALRGTLRNWYHPHMQQMFAGFRCAQSVS